MIVSKTPLRMSFFGGGTDFKTYYENSRFGYGSVISTALDMYVYITVNRRFDDKIRVVYYGNELVDHVDEVKHDIVRNALQIAGIEKGVEVVYSADIPLSSAGVGLSSSSALAVGVMKDFLAHTARGMPMEWPPPSTNDTEGFFIPAIISAMARPASMSPPTVLSRSSSPSISSLSSIPASNGRTCSYFVVFALSGAI